MKKRRQEATQTNKSHESPEIEIQENIQNVVYIAHTPVENQVEHTLHSTHLSTDTVFYITDP